MSLIRSRMDRYPLSTKGFAIFGKLDKVRLILPSCISNESYLTFDTLVLEKPRDIICIAYFDTWLRDVFSFSTKTPTYQIAATVKEMTSDQNRKKKDSGMNPRKRQKLVIPDKSLNMAISNSKIVGKEMYEK